MQFCEITALKAAGRSHNRTALSTGPFLIVTALRDRYGNPHARSSPTFPPPARDFPLFFHALNRGKAYRMPSSCGMGAEERILGQCPVHRDDHRRSAAGRGGFLSNIFSKLSDEKGIFEVEFGANLRGGRDMEKKI
eukprot:1393674-Amorphochlora_amoeboformis.AAC.1